MNDTDNRMKEALRRAMPQHETELSGDLWPRMLRRMDERTVRRPLLDWVLLALLAIWCALFPSIIPGLVYHL